MSFLLETNQFYRYKRLQVIFRNPPVFLAWCWIIIVMLLSACGGEAASPLPPVETPLAVVSPAGPTAYEYTITIPETLAVSTTMPVFVTRTPVSQASSPQPSLTPIIDTRLPPGSWMAWPVVPAVTARAKEIYQRGIALGNNPHSFSKIGDCQAIKEVLMGIYDIPERYQLAPEDKPLQETIDYFAGSFNRDGMAVRGGFNAASVLSPIWADPQYCQPGENPIACEFRVHKPSFVIISLEVWWEGRTVERYEAYMRQILDYAISKGVVPILSTKADNVEKDHSINLVNARLAYEYDLPFWNFWSAVQLLSNHGIDPNRDGFHISVEAWNVRSLTALQALDSIWRGVRQGGVQLTSTPLPSTTAIQPAQTFSPGLPAATILPASTPVSTPEVGPTPQGGSGKFVFALSQRTGELVEQQGIYLYDFTRQHLLQVAGAGYSLQAVSPDGKQMLVNHLNELSLVQVDGSGMMRLTDQFFPGGKTGAFWLSNGQYIVVIANRDGQNAIWLVTPNGASWLRLTAPGANPIGLLNSADLSRIYWQKGTCASDGTCIPESTWYTTMDGSTTQEMVGVLRPAFSPRGDYYVFTDPQNDSNLVVASLDGTKKRTVPFPDDKEVDNHVLDYAWAPDGSRLSLLVDVRSTYNGKSLRVRNLLLTPADLGIQMLSDLSELNLLSAWPPNGLDLLVTGTSEALNGYQVNFRLFNLVDKSVSVLDDKINLAGPDFLYVTNIFWVPPG